MIYTIKTIYGLAFENIGRIWGPVRRLPLKGGGGSSKPEKNIDLRPQLARAEPAKRACCGSGLRVPKSKLNHRRCTSLKNKFIFSYTIHVKKMVFVAWVKGMRLP